MCGITFVYSNTTPIELLKTRTSAALKNIAHRGPDGEGIEYQATWSIGHRRLSIIDLSGSAQPMVDSQRRFFLAYNGEVYNYKELRASLQSRWYFTSNGDTEVVLAGLALYGSEFLTRMEGMWAIALWDSHAETLLLSRDRMGKKPLYYTTSHKGIACASELPALRALSPDDWQEDLKSTGDYFRYGFFLPGYTAYKNIFEVLPGHSLTWSPHELGEHKSYWSLQPATFFGTSQDAAKKIRSTLIHAVERRLIADVEVGAFLSGGIDSSLITGIVRRELGRPLKTFTIGFQEAAFDERKFARIVADTFGTEHYEETLTQWSEKELEQLILDHVGQPFADASLLPTTLVSKIAARHVKVALSGDGADELFSGYQRYQARALMRWYSRLPRVLRGNIEKLIRSLPEPMAHHSRSILKKAHLFVDIAARQAAETPYIAPLLFSPGDLRQLAPDLINLGHLPPLIPEATEPDDIFRMMAADSLIYLPQDILVKVDRASMAQSIEARAPFLDRELVELAFNLPRQWHRHGFSGKQLLRKGFSDLLPQALWQRRKQGFGVPLHDWFRQSLGQNLRDWLQKSDSSVLDTTFALKMLNEHITRRRDHSQRLWAIYTYYLWRRAEAANWHGQKNGLNPDEL
jgi:asparagine synthase (glutamine-hydrolysing)